MMMKCKISSLYIPARSLQVSFALMEFILAFLLRRVNLQPVIQSVTDTSDTFVIRNDMAL